tara:strand:+ start:81 stop:323 length:243 start_codon:yes stop_codon:yes gene_type:complete
MNKVIQLINDLMIDRDRLSSSGLEIYNELRSKVNLETTDEIDNNITLMSKKFGLNKVKEMLVNTTSNEFEIELNKLKASK